MRIRALEDKLQGFAQQLLDQNGVNMYYETEKDLEYLGPLKMRDEYKAFKFGARYVLFRQQHVNDHPVLNLKNFEPQ